MRATRKRTRVLCALSMAATAALAARSAKAVSLSLYYGQDSSYANSNNGVFISNKYSYSPFGKNAQGEVSNFGNGLSAATVTPVTVSQTAPTTINLPVGSYLSLAIDAVLTGNVNPQAGYSQSNDAGPQPTYLGLSQLGFLVNSSDTTGTKLIPLSSQAPGTAPFTTLNGVPAYKSSVEINSNIGPNGGAAANAYTAAPQWLIVSSGGDVEPNLTGYDTAPHSSGGIGTLAGSTMPGAFPGAVNFTANGGTLGILSQFASATNQASYGAATDFADQLGFYGAAPGTVTLSPVVPAGSTLYWNYISVAAGQHQYQATVFGTNDTIGSLPPLVIDVGGVAVVPEPMTLGMFALGSLALMSRRPRGKG